MCDFTRYGGKSEEWLRLEKTLPTPPSLSQEELQRTANQGREDASREEMKTLAGQIHQQDHSIRARDGFMLEARSYRRASSTNRALPVVLYFHGGGFFFGTLSSDDAICARIAIDTGAVVLSVNYRHTPKYVFPTAFNDSEASFDWLQAHAQSFGGDPSTVVITGTSAGALLTVALVQTLFRDRHSARSSVKGFVPMVPCVVQQKVYGPYLEQMKDESVSSYVDNEFCPVQPLERLEFYLGLQFPNGYSADDRRANPGLAPVEELVELPPAVIGACGLDIFRDEDLLYAKRLHESGVPVRAHVFVGLPHDFGRYGNKLPSSETWRQVVHDGIRWVLSGPLGSQNLDIYAHSTSRLSSRQS